MCGLITVLAGDDGYIITDSTAHTISNQELQIPLVFLRCTELIKLVRMGVYLFMAIMEMPNVEPVRLMRSPSLRDISMVLVRYQRDKLNIMAKR